MRKFIIPAAAVAAALALVPFFMNADDAAPADNVPAAAPAAEKPAVPAGWTDDFAAAKKRAAQEGKDLFVLFTGSDWCVWCMRLDEEILGKPGVAERLAENFVPVYIDAPRDDSRLSETARKQNPELIARYRVQGFPSVLLMDADGVAFAETGYREGGEAAYLAHLAELTESGKNSPAYKAKKSIAAVPADAPDRAARLDALLAALPAQDQLANSEYVEEVLAADPDGKLGFRAKYPYFTTVLPLEREFRQVFSGLASEAAKIMRRKDPSSREEAMAIVEKTWKKIISENRGKVDALLEKTKAAQKNFPADSLGGRRLQQLGDRLEEMLTRFGGEPAGNAAKPAEEPAAAPANP